MKGGKRRRERRGDEERKRETQDRGKETWIWILKKERKMDEVRRWKEKERRVGKKGGERRGTAERKEGNDTE